ncbi:FIGNL1-interacting regulator of recombination and mitosis-like isoform X2 [Ptychodera flava]|uniref:FIGNL1-interacting regulator of recombination and mitosis-like isoform X2 n=1 Tax=Ptychodera flava TaxID=63121 RepID=UPI00396A6FA6
MSQSSFLEDVSSWDIERCKQHLSDTLPELTSIFSSKSSSADQRLSILKTLTSSFLPCIEIYDVEIQFFSQVLPQTNELFDSTLASIHARIDNQQDENLQTILLQCLQLILDIMECVGQCLQYVCSLCSNGVTLEQIQSLPTTVVNIIKGSYNHCKESTSLYGDAFHLVSEPLGQLFKKSFELEKLLLTVLHALNVTSSQDDVSAATEVCHGLYQICVIISNVDDTVLLRTWKSLMEFATKNKLLLRDRLEVSNMVIMLSQEIRSTYKYLLQLAAESEPTSSQSANEKIFARKFKVCRFFVTVLMTLVKDFDGYLGPCFEELYHLILDLQSISPPSVYSSPISPTKMQEMKQSLLVFIEPLISMLLSTRNFAEIVTKSDKEMPAEWCFPHCMLLIQVIKELTNQSNDVIDLWLTPVNHPDEECRDDIIKAVFKSVQKCYIEISLPVQVPGVMYDGRPYREISLYEHICIHLCGFVASLPSMHFHTVENCFLENTLSQNLYCAVLAMDLWSFVARWGSSSLVSHYVDLVVDILTKLPVNHSTVYLNLEFMLQRLISQMDQKHQMDFVKSYPTDKHSHLWTSVPVSVFATHELKQLVCENITQFCTARIQQWTDTLPKTKSSLSELETYLKLLCNIYQNTDPASLPLSGEMQASTVEAVCSLWTYLPLDRVSSHHAVYLLVTLSSWILSILQPSELSQIISSLLTIMSASPPIVFRLAVVEFLRNFRKKTIPPSFEGQILSKLPMLFSQVLNDNDVVLHQKALEAFSVFAEETVYEDVVPECLQAGNIQDIVVHFLSKIPHAGHTDVPSDVEQLRNQQVAIREYLLSSDNQTAVDLDKIMESHQRDGQSSDIEPNSKRTRYDDSGYRDAVNVIKKQLDKMQQLKKSIPSPVWLTDELNKIQDKLQTFSS